MNKINKKFDYNKDGESTLLAFRNPKIYAQLKNTGAVVEDGIAIVGVNLNNIEDYTVPTQTDTINEPKKPYALSVASYSVYGTLYFPTYESDKLVELYKGIKKIGIRKKNLDIRELRTLGEKIKYLFSAAFYGNNPDYKSYRYKKVTFTLWILTGVLNTLSGKTLLYVLNYLCAILQLDLFELVYIIKASTIDPKKKEYILANIEKNGINLSAIDLNTDIRLYTRIDNIENHPEVEEIIKKNRTFSL